MPILEKARKELQDALKLVLKRNYSDLTKEKVTIDLLEAMPGLDEKGEEKDEHAIVVGGYPADGCCSVTPYRWRVKGCADAEIQIDKHWWDHHSEKERLALIDHELYHLELKRNKKDDTVRRDDLGRPKLGIRKHDREFGWFDEVAERNGEHSHEVQQARTLLHPEARKIYQLELDFPKQQPNRTPASKGGRKAAATR